MAPDERPAAAAPPAPWPSRLQGRNRTVAGVVVLVLAVGAIVVGFLLPGRGEDTGEGEVSFDVPAGWTDRTEALAELTPDVRPLKVFVGPETEGYTSLLNVVQRPREDGNPPLEELTALARENLRNALDAEVGEARPLQLGGGDAFVYDYRYEVEGKQLQGRQVVTYRGDNVIFLNLSTHQSAFTRDAVALDRVIESWRWSPG